MTVECCADNLDDELRAELAESAARVNEQYCLQRCGLCYRESFVVVDGTVVRAADADALETKLTTAGLLRGDSER